ncbi:hypothetical protein BJX61DRAFT_514647 [Aspergillus egyptiacus]|nr:hypothetical protein BJX61DRAFT_514647 [Aspergillus egyptiacus]
MKDGRGREKKASKIGSIRRWDPGSRTPTTHRHGRGHPKASTKTSTVPSGSAEATVCVSGWAFGSLEWTPTRERDAGTGKGAVTDLHLFRVVPATGLVLR